MRILLSLVFFFSFFGKVSAQNGNLIDVETDNWIVKYCGDESSDVEGIVNKDNEIFSYPELKIKVDIDVFFNIVLFLPRTNKPPFYAIQLSFIDDATDSKISLFKGVPYVNVKLSKNKVDSSFFEHSNSFFAFKGPLKYNQMPLRSATYCFILPADALEDMLYSYKSSDSHQMIFELHYGNKPNQYYRQFAFIGKEMTNLLFKIMAVRYSPR